MKYRCQRRRTYQPRTTRHNVKRREIDRYPVMTPTPMMKTTSTGRRVSVIEERWRFSLDALRSAFRVGVPQPPPPAPEPKPSKFVMKAEHNGVKFFKATWDHLKRSKYSGRGSSRSSGE